MIESYIRYLTGDSLQSVDQLNKVKIALGLSVEINTKKLKPIFMDLNFIIHELDIDFSAPRRNRRNRKLNVYIEACNMLLALTEAFFEEVKEKLEQE